MEHEAEHKEYEAYLNETADIPVLAEFTQYANDGEAWITTRIYPRYTPEGVQIPKPQILDAAEMAGMKEHNDDRMGQCQQMAPTIVRTVHSWVVEQIGYANV